MKYQITCDNCGTQFIVEAEEGQTIECKCPHCQGVMEVTLPLVSAGLQYDQQAVYEPQAQQPQAEKPEKSNKAIFWGVLIGLLLLAAGVGAYFAFQPSSPENPVTDVIPNDTIPYETPIREEAVPSVDTVVTAPVQTAPEEEEEYIEEAPEEPVDTADAAYDE